MTSYLNVGCGSRYHPTWTNLDLYAVNGHVIAHDLRRPLPFNDASFDLVYHSHVLEHFTPEGGKQLVAECFRVLRSGGVLRIAVPDLEQIVRQYLAVLEKAVIGDPSAEPDYDWMVLELFDQTVRDVSGGRMLKYLREQPIRNESFVLSRVGNEARKVIQREQARTFLPNGTIQSVPSRLGHLIDPRKLPSRLKRLFLRCVLGNKAAALHLGEFRLGGEVHLWMYDRFSLGRLLQRTGLAGVMRRDAQTSYVNDWAKFNLDTEPNGIMYKPDSLFMEGLKPSA